MTDNIEERIQQWYPQAKVYFDGSHYVAIPHTENKCRRRKAKHEVITVSEDNGKLTLHKSAKELFQVYVVEDEEKNPFDNPELFQELAIEDVIKEHITEKSEAPLTTVKAPTIKRKTTRKEIFNELYSKYISLNRKQKREAILKEMLPLFKTRESAVYFVENNLDRKWRNIVSRRVRFARKAFNQEFNYFATFTYDDRKQTEESFRKKLKLTLTHFASRKGWKYMGVWERGKKTNRLHFHALVYVPGGLDPNECEGIEIYNFKHHQRKLINQSKFFADRFGRNEFEELDRGPLFGHALGYIMKYMEKSEEKIVYSKGLYQYFVSDLMGDDVLAFCGLKDHKLVLADDFICWEEGTAVGKVSAETIALLPKSS